MVVNYMNKEKKKITRDIVPDDFSLGLAIFDGLPVLFFGIATIMLGTLLSNPLFLMGAFMCFFAGVCKVLWKIIVVIKRKNIWWMFMQMRVLMPVGFLMMILSSIISWRNPEVRDSLHNIIVFPVNCFFIAFLVGMILMMIFAFTLDGTKAKNNWIEQIINALAQFAFLFGIMLLVYAADYYHADEDAIQFLPENAAVEVAVLSDHGITVEIVDDMAIFRSRDHAMDTGVGLVFYPGAKVEYTAYAPLMAALAKQGMTAVVVKMPLNLAFFGVNRMEDAMTACPDVREWYIGGHSLGGVAATSWVVKHSQEISGLILLGAYANQSVKEVRVLSVYGSEDQVLNRKAYEKNRVNLPIDAKEIEIAGGNHGQFGSYGFQKGDGKSKISKEEQMEATVDEIVKFTQNIE